VTVLGVGAHQPSPGPADVGDPPTPGPPGAQRILGGAVLDRLPPPRRPVATRGPGTFAVAPAPPGADPGAAVRFTVEVEHGLPFRPAEAARVVEATLADDRGWTGRLGTTFARVGADAERDLRVLLTTPATTDGLCAPLETRGRVSCRNGDLVVLNAVRWAEGIPDYAGAVADYRRYVVNHEVGHALGQAHVECPEPGAPAPVMQQQTYGLDGCRRNVWPTVA